MQIFNLIANAVILLSVVVAVLSVWAVLSRLALDVNEAFVRRLRARMARAVRDHLAGKADFAKATAALGSQRRIALDVLVEIADSMPAEDRERLLPLFRHFRFDARERTALRHRNWARRRQAVIRLGYMASSDAIPDLLRCLDDTMLEVRIESAHALARLRAPQAVLRILHALALPGAWPIQRAADILQEIGEAAAQPLLHYLRGQPLTSQEPAVAIAVKALGMLREQDAALPIIGFLMHPDPDLRLACVKALGQIRDTRAVAPLCASLSDSSWEVRNAAAEALATLKDPSAIPALTGCLSDSSSWVRLNSGRALFRIGGSGIEILKDSMHRHPDRYARDVCQEILAERHALPLPGAS